MEKNFCSYCSIVLGSEAELLTHCNSEGHQLIIMSDEGREWKFRAPARGVGSDQYALCQVFANTGKCNFGALCCDAHGEEELQEWKERFDYRQMKLQGAKECKLQGRNYTEQLLERWLTSTNPNLVIADTLKGVAIQVEPDTNLSVSEKNCCREWVFKIIPKVPLRHVALLYETHRNHFRISTLKCGFSCGNHKEFNLGPHCQEWNSNENTPFDEYIIKVRFVTAIYGTFRQDIVFDFGFEPVLVQKLCVDAASVSNMEKLNQARETVISFTERWSNADVSIIPFENRPYSLGDQEKNLLNFYPAPNCGNKFNMTQSVMEPTLTEKNYCSRQHELLCIEEMAQYELLSRYNVQATLNLSNCYLLTPNSAVTAKYSHNGELFANMKLTSVLSEDSASGRLVLTNCNTVLLASVSSRGDKPRKVYEAVIEDKTKTVLYIRMSKECCEELNLKKDSEFEAEVQFQLNRLPICEMHFAVDRLHPPSLVFPNISTCPQISSNNQSELDSKVALNPKQKEAVLAITTPLSTHIPPVLIIGPFGTGKTYTLAQAVKRILYQPESRVLICTHSNSAADIYIREYLHPCVAQGRTEATPLRIYYRHRWVATVHPTVQQYCLVNYEGSERTFLMPTVENIKNHKVIVTTLSTARYLVQLGLPKGFFTHILIDEAAQAMECEAIMPLSLANENTRIVLAGDHMQLSPEVYSEFCQQRNLHTSLLERLYNLYPDDFVSKILLCENYRSHEAIIKYTSELFYNNHLEAVGGQPKHSKYFPLTFFTARGEDIQDCNSTAFHNYAEINEIVERVMELKKDWPEVWGEQDETSIGVVSPYYDQVVRIRAELRKKKLHGVSVERVLNVQGKQFRVIFLSAVRTRQTCGGNKAESELDHGFLSNAKLLNTAITRAQSLVAVVGDPVSLCSVGKCRKLWEKFIFTCHSEGSLYGITWDSLRSQLDSMELKKNFILNPLAPEFIPGRMYHGLPNTPGENFLPNVPPPHPYLYLSFQGHPIIQGGHLINLPPPPPTYRPMIFPTPNESSMPPVIPSAAPIQHPFQNYKHFPSPRPQIAPQPTTRLQTSGFPPWKMVNGGRAADINVPSKEFNEGGVGMGGRIVKRSEAPFPTSIASGKQSISRSEDMNENEEINRLLGGNRPLEQVSNFHLPNEMELSHGLQNGFNFEDKEQKLFNSVKREDMSLKNDLASDFNTSLFSEQLHNIKPTANGVWSPLASKSRFEQELQRSSPQAFEEYRNPFNAVNGIVNEIRPRNRDLFDTPISQPMFMSPQPPAQPEKWHNSNENTNLSPDSAPPLATLVYNSFLEKLSFLQRIIPPGMDVLQFLENEEQARNFMQILSATEGPNSAQTFFLFLMCLKRDQDMLQELHSNSQKKLINRQFCSPTRTVPESHNAVPKNVPAFQSSRLVGNAHTDFNSDSIGMDNPISPFSMPRIFPTERIESTLFNNGEQNRGEMPKPYSGLVQPLPQWPTDNIVIGRSNFELPLIEMSKLSMGETVDNRMINGEALHNGDAFLGMHQARRRFDHERPDSRRMWSVPEPKISPLDQGWPKSNPLIFSEPAPNAKCNYLSRLRKIYNSADTGDINQGFTFEMPKEEDISLNAGSLNLGSVTAGPLSMSYPDIPNILSAASSDENSSKVIRKPVPRSSDTTSPYTFDMKLQSRNESPLRFSQMSTEGMTYAKIVRSLQQ